MKKETLSLQDRKRSGRCILTYSESGRGKSYQLLTLPDPLLIINAEAKSIQDVIFEALEARGETNRKITIWEFENFSEYMKNISELKEKYDNGTFPYQSIVFDGMSFAQSDFKLELEDDRYDLMVEKDKKKKRDEINLADMFQMEQADWGKNASMMKRITFLLNRISRYGINVVCNAWEMSSPKWNRLLGRAPYFQGKEYATVMLGYFNIVGLLVANPNTRTGYPPVIRFVPEGDDFLARAGNAKLAAGTFKVNDSNEVWQGAGILDYGKIVKVLDSK